MNTLRVRVALWASMSRTTLGTVVARRWNAPISEGARPQAVQGLGPVGPPRRMTVTDVYFTDLDFDDRVPAPGFYPCRISSARHRSSAQGNAMLQVVYALEDVPVRYERVAEYFVLDGASSRGLAMVRRRLLELFRVCGRDPQPGDPICAADLEGAVLEVRLEHEPWEAQVRLRVASHRRRTSSSVPF